PGDLLPAKSHARTRRAGCSEALRESSRLPQQGRKADVPATACDGLFCSPSSVLMFTSVIRLSPAPLRLRARTTLISSLLSSAALLIVTASAPAQSTIGPVEVSPPKPQTTTRPSGD